MATAFQLLTLTIPILLSWLAWWLVCAGWGVWFARACGRRVRSADELIHAFWSGWALTIVFLMFWHFFRRIDGLTAAIVVAIGLAGLASHARRLARGAGILPAAGMQAGSLRYWPRRKILFALAFTLLAAVVANHTLMPPLNFDTGLYHLPQVRWMHTYRIVPGLGNLHGRLAFNQSYFLFVAMLDTGPWKGLSWHWVSGLTLLTMVAQLGPRIFSRLRPGEAPTRRLFWLLLAAPVLDQLNNFNISSPTPDIPIYALSIALAIDLLDLILLPPRARRDVAWRVLRIVVIGLTGITIKFNFVIFGSASAILAVILGCKMRNAECGMRNKILRTRTPLSADSNIPTHNSKLTTHNQQPSFRIPHSAFRIPSVALLLAFLILGPYVARDVILSGWIAYPMPLLPMPVSWRLPRTAVDQEIAMITGFSRAPMEEGSFPLKDWSWIPNWWTYMLEFQKFEFMLPLGLAGFCLFVALYQRRRAITAVNARAMWLFLSVPAASLIFWAQTAPHPRFAGGAFWIFAAGANAFILTRFGTARRRLIFALTAALTIVSFGFLNPLIPFKIPGPDRGFYPYPAINDDFDYTTSHGLVIHTRPFRQFQTWDMPLPNTPYVKHSLRLRRPGDLRGGFVIDGPLTEKTS